MRGETGIENELFSQEEHEFGDLENSHSIYVP
jgi:hypothetical protein